MNIEKINPFRQPDLVTSIVSVYQKVFGNAPWNEGCKCPVCGQTYSLDKNATYCLNCRNEDNLVILTEYWPTSRVISDFYREMQKPNAICIVAIVDYKVVGFTWGYEINISGEIDFHLDAPGLSEVINGSVFYLDEVAVLPEFQGQGIGSQLINQIFLSQPNKKVLLRTLDESKMFKIIKKMDGGPIMPISNNRVIMQLSL